MAIEFVVYGKAQPAGSKRAFVSKKTGRAFVTDANANSKPWQSLVTAAAMEAYTGPLLEGPVRLTLRFFFLRPKCHYGSGKNSSILKQSAPWFPTGRPDVLKLARGVEDALTGVVWRDDAQIVDERLEKHYVESQAKCFVLVEEA